MSPAHSSSPRGGGAVTAHGTIFEIAVTDRRKVTVRLLKGSVSVAMTSAPDGIASPAATRWLVPGERLEFSDASAAALRRAQGLADAADRIAEVDDVRLAELVARVNRDAAIRIRLDPSLADLRVSGRFGIADSRRLADSLASAFGLSVRAINPTEIRLMQAR